MLGKEAAIFTLHAADQPQKEPKIMHLIRVIKNPMFEAF